MNAEPKMDDWRGEHLIRSPKAPTVEAKPIIKRLALRGRKTCGVCGTGLHEDSRSGVCRQHNHAQPYCQCRKCVRNR